MGERIKGSQRHRNYFEAILQLRNPDKDVVQFVEDAVKGAAETGSSDVFISKRKKVTNGWDFYISAKDFAVGLGRALYDAFGGEIKITKKLFTQHKLTSRLLYRVTVLYRMADFRNGDYVLLYERPYKITSLGRRVYAVDIESRQQREFNYKETIRGSQKLEVIDALISKVRPQLEVIHPETFQSTPVFPINKTSRLVPGEKTKIVFSGEKLWLPI
ncbi:hypothetical protein HYU18_02415 [Candidatus Woesearchaeota archaeon]|nr:hypothetical protein [Candidatus Woesearchaeota archaeon]